MSAPFWKMLRVPADRGLVVVTGNRQDAAALLALRDPALGQGAGEFISNVVDGILIGSVWDAVGVLPDAGVRDALLVDPAGRTARAVLSDAGVRAFGLLRPEGITFAAWAASMPKTVAAIRVADAIIASVPPPRGIAEEVTAR